MLHGVDLSRGDIREIAFETGFCRRTSGKIDSPDYLVQLCLQSLEGTVSHNDLAGKIEARTGVCASRQAVAKKSKEQCEQFFRKILERVIQAKVDMAQAGDIMSPSRFNRILIQDSTVIRIPLRLFEVFSGVKNCTSAVCNARIQGTYDLLAGRFISFSIDPYSKNDLAAAPEIIVQPGDLVLRDRGYFIVEVIDTMRKNGADSISRYKHGHDILDPVTEQPINLLERLQHDGSLDMDVLVGAKQKVRLRILAAPVGEEAANRRRMKLKKEMKGRSPSAELLKLMSWTIFLTTIGAGSDNAAGTSTGPGSAKGKAITIKEIFALYGLRWRIENIFKTWKSNFNFATVHNVSANQLRVLLTARLIMITLIYQCIYQPLALRVANSSERQLSLMKFMRYISKNLQRIYELLNPLGVSQQVLNALIRYCSYESRNRTNFQARMEDIILNIITLG